jgi:transcriptional regulator with XRE-family HTH domain
MVRTRKVERTEAVVRRVGIIIPAAALKRSLALRGWSQADLAQASGVSPTTISAIASGRNHYLAPRVARKLAAALEAHPVRAGITELIGA